MKNEDKKSQKSDDDDDVESESSDSEAEPKYLLKSDVNKKVACRDSVQFVEFEELKEDFGGKFSVAMFR